MTTASLLGRLGQNPLARASSRVADRARSAGWDVPKWTDPRFPFAAILTLYGVLGFTWLGFNRSLLQMLAIVLSGAVLDMGLAWVLRGKKIVPLSAYISCCSLALLLNYSHASWVLFFPVLLTVGSKYVLTFKGRHVFNPSMFGVSVSLLATQELITAAPAYQWAGGSITMSLFMLTAAVALFAVKIGRNWLILSFLFFYSLQTALRAYVLRHHIPPEMLFIGTIASPPFFLFTFYMITDPATSPKTPKGQVLFAFVITLVDLWLHVKENVFTFFYAAFFMGSVKFLFLHLKAFFRDEGPREYVTNRLQLPVLRPLATVGVLLVVSIGVWSAWLRPAAADNVTASFHMETLSAERTGIRTEPGPLLEQVDPRIQHIAKWVLSVGDAVAVGDVDGDGRMDLFLTNLLKRAEDRHALYRNVGDFRFERVPLPALDERFSRFREDGIGLPAGATFVDYDGDGDEDLALAVGFGKSRLYRNRLIEDGALGFEDVSEQVGLDEHTVSLAVTFLDFDKDAQLDMFVTNSVDPLLRDYSPPRPLNLFALPEAEYDGDRRMFHFMHDGWHDASNGGPNSLYLAREDGTFAMQSRAELGLTETHWTLAVSTADLNRDGYTDLYAASDFGPDDVYLNRRGRGFEHVVGESFGDIGKDTYKGMNASIADLDRNGYQDVYVSNVHHSLQAEGSLLWMVYPTADPFHPEFRDEATQRGALNERRFGWGAGLGDLDLDGWVDIVQANGMVDDRLDPHGYDRRNYWYVNHKLMQSGPEIHTYADMWGDIRGRVIYPNEARRVYLSRPGRSGERYFVDVAEQVGVASPDNSRGVATADFDDDGDLDLVVTNQHGPVSIYRNDRISNGRVPADAHYVGLRIVGDGETTHRSAVGSQVEIAWTENGETQRQFAEVDTLGGFSAQGDPRLHFGLGAYHGSVDVTVDWYGGEAETFSVAADGYHVLTQGTSSEDR